MADGNKAAVRDLVWPRADTVIWLDYPLRVSIWRLGKRAIRRTSVLKSEAANGEIKTGFTKKFFRGARGVLTALRSHRGQRRLYARLFSEPQNQRLAIVRLRSPRATHRWLEHVLVVESRAVTRLSSRSSGRR